MVKGSQEIVKNVGDVVIDSCRNKKVVKTSDIRKAILGRLGRVSKGAVSAWRKDETMKRKAEKKKTTKKKRTTKKVARKKTAKRKPKKKARTTKKKKKRR